MLAHRLPNISVINEFGEKHKFHSLIKGKTIVLNMFYSQCQIKCQPLGKLMKRVNLLLKNYINTHPIEFISITLDAKNDTISDINNFKQIVSSSECLNWHFYTGDYYAIEKLRYKLGMYNAEPEVDAIKSNHSGHFLIFNERLGFIKHTESFDNPVDIARKVIQIIPRNFCTHSYNLDKLDFSSLTDEEIFENIHSMSSVFTVPFLSEDIKEKYNKYAEIQRGFQYNPLQVENKTAENVEKSKSKTSCCCSK